MYVCKYIESSNGKYICPYKEKNKELEMNSINEFGHCFISHLICPDDVKRDETGAICYITETT